ncbi:unnamed protein product [Rhodiola kirilowii]
MEKNEAIAVENGGGVFEAIAVVNGLGTEAEKEEIAVENNGVGEKKEASKSGKTKAGAGVRQKKKKLLVSKVAAGDQATAVVVTSEGGAKGCRLQVSNTKKPLFFYLNVAKRYIKQNNYVELSALGMAIPTVVTIAEILKKDGWAIEKDITISTVTLKDEVKDRVIKKAKIGILLEKPKDFEKQQVVVAKDSSKIGEKGVVAKDSSETIGKITEKKDLFNTDRTLTEKKDLHSTSTKLTEATESSAYNSELEKKDTCGTDEKIADKEKSKIVLVSAGGM